VYPSHSNLAKRRLTTGRNVRKVQKVCIADTDCTYSVSFEHEGGEHTLDGLDAVIIAAPLEFANVTWEGFIPNPGAKAKREYQRTHVTFVVGDLNLRAYFGAEGDQPQAIITPETSAVEFTRLSHPA
jgi:hypothetical protein